MPRSSVLTEGDIATRHTQFAARLALRLLRLTRTVGGGLYVFFSTLGRILAPLGRFSLRHIVLPAYKLGVTTKLRIQRLALPARGFVIFLVSNRYLFHTTLGLMALVTFLVNIHARQAHAQDVGQSSLLFALATDQHTEVVEEIVQPEHFAKDAHYLASSAMLYVPNIDFDYNTDEDTLPPSQFAVPGTIAAAPVEDQGKAQVSQAPRTKTEIYVVKENDTISSIAQQFGVNIGTILWNNNLTERQYIRPGDALRVPPVSGMLVTVKKGDTVSKLAATYGADEADILAFNNVSEGTPLPSGSELIIPGGRPPAPVQDRVIVAVRRESPVPSRERPKPTPIAVATPANKPQTETTPAEIVSPDELNANEGEGNVSEDGSSGFKPEDVDTSNLPKTRLLWPTSSHVITQYYGWRHTGVDIDGDYASPIYAAEDGVVEKAGWNSGGYGLMILLDHAGGLVTRYAHTSKMFIKAGDTVHKGEVIAMVGTTGRSTGTHLHFEVYTNGKRTNPLAYIK